MSWWKDTLKYGTELRGQAYNLKKAKLAAQLPELVVNSLSEDKTYKEITETELIYLTAELSLIQDMAKYDNKKTYAEDFGVFIKIKNSDKEKFYLPQLIQRRGTNVNKVVESTLSKLKVDNEKDAEIFVFRVSSCTKSFSDWFAHVNQSQSLDSTSVEVKKSRHSYMQSFVGNVREHIKEKRGKRKLKIDPSKQNNRTFLYFCIAIFVAIVALSKTILFIFKYFYFYFF